MSSPFTFRIIRWSDGAYSWEASYPEHPRTPIYRSHTHGVPLACTFRQCEHQISVFERGRAKVEGCAVSALGSEYPVFPTKRSADVRVAEAESASSVLSDLLDRYRRAVPTTTGGCPITQGEPIQVCSA